MPSVTGPGVSRRLMHCALVWSGSSVEAANGSRIGWSPLEAVSDAGRVTNGRKTAVERAVVEHEEARELADAASVERDLGFVEEVLLRLVDILREKASKSTTSLSRRIGLG